jgi:hypothetical protein
VSGAKSERDHRFTKITWKAFMRLVRFAWPVSLAFFLVACGSTSAVKLSPKIAVQAPETTGFRFQDERPAEERLSRVVEGHTGVNKYFGDDTLSPDAPTLLRAWLYNNMGAELKGRQVTLSEFVVNVYDPAVTVNQAGLAAAGGGALTALFIKGIESSRSEKIVHIRIQGKIDSEAFAVVGSDKYQGRVSDENVQATLVQTLDKAVADARRAAAAVK